MLWIKAWHIIFMVTWFAGLFYLPRLFVYHAMSEDAISQERFKVMERKLFYGIMTPGAILTIVFGVWLWLGYGITGGWLMAKLLLVVGLEPDAALEDEAELVLLGVSMHGCRDRVRCQQVLDHGQVAAPFPGIDQEAVPDALLGTEDQTFAGSDDAVLHGLNCRIGCVPSGIPEIWYP